MTSINLLGMLIGCITSIAFLPHVIKTWQAKTAVDVSLVMFILATISVVSWLVYGITSGNSAIIIVNTLVLLSAAFIISFKLLITRKKGPTNEELLAQLLADEN